MNTLLAVTPETWIVTGLGFGIVVVLLICLIFILQGFGVVMQKILAPKAPKAAAAPAPAPAPAKKEYAQDADGATKAAIAMALALANGDEEKAAVAYALHLYYNNAHDRETYALTLRPHATAWNDKSFGINNLIK